MSFEVQLMESPSVVWSTALPHVDRSCSSPVFSLNSSEVYWTISGHFAFECGGYEEWHFQLKSQSTPPSTSVAFYLVKKNGELVRCFVGEIGYGRAFKLTSHKLSKTGITDDIISMMFVFDCRFKCSRDISKAPATPSNAAKHTKQFQPEKPTFDKVCFRNFSEDIQKLFDNQEHSDAVLKCGDRTFSVNRNILSARSEVFAAMFRNKMSENQSGMVEITDMESHVLEQFLRFVYSGRLDALTMDTVFELYRAGDKYAVPCLKRKCSSFLRPSLSTDNVCQVLHFADMFDDTTLLDSAISFVVGKETFLQSASWNSFAKDHPALAVKVYQEFHAI